MSESKCSSCQHKRFREMIKHPYGYAGPIPCIGCVHFSWLEDNYSPVSYEIKDWKKETR